MYYREYEKEWLKEHRQVITVAWIKNPNHANVTLLRSVLTAPGRTGPGLAHWPLPLTSVPLRHFSISFTRDSNNAPLQLSRVYAMMRTAANVKQPHVLPTFTGATYTIPIFPCLH
jgi:hypothetical protein